MAMMVKSRNTWLVMMVLVRVEMWGATLVDTKWTNKLTAVMEVWRVIVGKTILTSERTRIK